MKLENELIIYSHMPEEDVTREIDRLMSEVTAFANIETNRALWVEKECECVYIKSSDRSSREGGKIACKDMPKVIRNWLLHVYFILSFDLRDEEIVNGVHDPRKWMKVVIENSRNGSDLRISFLEQNGDVADVIDFVMAECEELACREVGGFTFNYG